MPASMMAIRTSPAMSNLVYGSSRTFTTVEWRLTRYPAITRPSARTVAATAESVLALVKAVGAVASTRSLPP